MWVKQREMDLSIEASRTYLSTLTTRVPFTRCSYTLVTTSGNSIKSFSHVNLVYSVIQNSNTTEIIL